MLVVGHIILADERPCFWGNSLLRPRHLLRNMSKRRRPHRTKIDNKPRQLALMNLHLHLHQVEEAHTNITH